MEVYTSTCELGCAHGLGGGSSSGGVSEVHGWSSGLLGRVVRDAFLQFYVCLFTFLFPSPSHCSLSPERATHSSSCSTHRWAEPHHALPHPPPPLPEESGWLTTGPPAATSATTGPTCTSLPLPLPPWSDPPTFGCTDGQISQVLWYAVQKVPFFPLSGCLISCKSREKKGMTHATVMLTSSKTFPSQLSSL